MRIHRDITANLPYHMIDPTVRYPRPLPALLDRWYVYLPDEGHSIMVVPAGYYHPAAPAENLVAIPVRTALAASYTVATTGHLVMELPLRKDGKGIAINEADREFTIP